MGNRLKFIQIASTVLCSLVLLFSTSLMSFAKEDNVEDLKKQIETLQKRVEELEAGQAKAIPQNAVDPSGLFRRNPVYWDPFEEITRMQQEMDRMFQDSFRMGGPASKGMFRSNMFYDDSFDIKEDKDKYTIEFDMKGMNQGKIDIQVHNQSLTVKGEYSEEQKQEGKNSYFGAKSYATFMRSIPIPPDADTTKMNTENKGDKLIITLPKKAI